MTEPQLSFGLSLMPAAAGASHVVELAKLADREGLDLIGVPDHSFEGPNLDTWTLLAYLAGVTERVSLFPNVANLPLRPPPLLAKAVASLDVLSGGRATLGLGAGTGHDEIVSMGLPGRTAGQAVSALEEGIEIIRLAWSGEEQVSFEGVHYRLDGYRPGAGPVHRVGVWLGAMRPRMLALTGRLTDGWVVSLPLIAPEDVPEAASAIDRAARSAGRDPTSIRRVYNIPGAITDDEPTPAESQAGRLVGSPDRWIETLTRWARELRFDTFMFVPIDGGADQVTRFAAEVAPGVRAALNDH